MTTPTRRTNFFRAGFMGALGASIALTICMPIVLLTTGVFGVGLISQLGKTNKEAVETQPLPQDFSRFPNEDLPQVPGQNNNY